jgi:hypothetical protein
MLYSIPSLLYRLPLPSAMKTSTMKNVELLEGYPEHWNRSSAASRNRHTGFLASAPWVDRVVCDLGLIAVGRCDRSRDREGRVTPG